MVLLGRDHRLGPRVCRQGRAGTLDCRGHFGGGENRPFACARAASETSMARTLSVPEASAAYPLSQSRPFVAGTSSSPRGPLATSKPLTKTGRIPREAVTRLLLRAPRGGRAPWRAGAVRKGPISPGLRSNMPLTHGPPLPGRQQAGPLPRLESPCSGYPALGRRLFCTGPRPLLVAIARCPCRSLESRRERRVSAPSRDPRQEWPPVFLCR